jgi:hypothetical protein
MSKKPLTPAQQRRRTLDRTIYNVAQPLSGKALRHAVAAMVDAQIKPSIGMLDRQAQQARANQAFAQNKLQGFYQFLGGQQKGLVDAAAAAANQGNAAQQAIAGGAQSALAQAGSAAQARMSQDAAVRGNIAGVPSGADAVAQRFTEQATSMGARAGADATRAADYNTAGQQAIAGQGLANLMRGQEQGQQVTNAFAKTIGDILGKKTDLAGQRAGLVADLGTKLRQNEFNNAVTMEGLGIKKQDLAQSFAEAQQRIGETNRHNTAMEGTAAKQAMLSDRRYQLDLDKFGAAKAKDRYQRKHHLGPYKTATPRNDGATPTQRASAQAKSTNFWAKVDDALHNTVPTIFQAMHQQNVDARAGKKDANGNPIQPISINDRTVTAVLKKQGVKDPILIEAIIAGRGHHGRIPAQLAAKLVDAGYLVPPKRLQRGQTAAQHAGTVLGGLFG